MRSSIAEAALIISGSPTMSLATVRRLAPNFKRTMIRPIKVKMKMVVFIGFILVGVHSIHVDAGQCDADCDGGKPGLPGGQIMMGRRSHHAAARIVVNRRIVFMGVAFACHELNVR